MRITFYTNNSEKIALTKSKTQIVRLDGTLKDGTSIIDPSILCYNIDRFIADINYFYIDETGRYYFITGVEVVRNGLWQISGHVDVLSTYKDAILQNRAIIQRSESNYNLKLNDGLFKTQQNPRITTIPFGTGFTTSNYVLALAGHTYI